MELDLELANLIEVPINISDINGKPCIILKKSITDMELIKALVSSAFHDQPLVVMPKFTDKTRSINSLIQKGILYRNQNGEFFFTF